jgi:hypothetical protein
MQRRDSKLVWVAVVLATTACAPAVRTAETLPPDKVRMLGQEGDAAKYCLLAGPTGQGIAGRATTPTPGPTPRTSSGRSSFPVAATRRRSSGKTASS